MANRSYQELWHNTYTMLQNLIAEDVPSSFERDLSLAFSNVAPVYLRYVKVITNLEKCYDLIVHPQKRLVIGKMLEGAIGRLLELKNELVNIESRDFHFFDEQLLNFKMTPHDLELPVPHWYIPSEEGQACREAYQEFSKKHIEEKERFVENINSPHEASLILQRHERGRQGRKHAVGLLTKQQHRETERVKAEKFLDRQEAAVIIQKSWRGYQERQQVRNEWTTERRLLGMLPPLPPENFEDTYAYKREQYLQLRHEAQMKSMEDYESALVTVKEALKKENEMKLMEKFEDDIREWYNNYRERNNEFPHFPSEKDGGSKLIDDPLAMDEFQRSKSKNKKTKERAKVRKAEKEKKKKKKEKKNQETDIGYSGEPSLAVPLITQAFAEYKAIWEDYKEPDYSTQKHDEKLIEKEMMPIIKEEMRLKVDDYMREELQGLHLAQAKDKGKKGKRKKARKKKLRRGRKRKKRKKDITAHRSLEELYEELLQKGIIKPYPKTSLDDFNGGYNLIGTALSKQEIEPVWHYPGDLRQVVIQYCILPLSSPKIHETVPCIRSVFITGPPGIGKKTLVYAVCTAVNATLFDLTPSNIVGKYPGKAGKKMLLHLVNKVGRAMEPSIILINDAEKPFIRRVPKTDLSEPKRLRKSLPKFVKGIKPTDLFMVCGISNLPFMITDMKGLKATFSKIIYVPPPDYSSRHILWKKFITLHGGKTLQQFQLGTLSKISEGYTGQQIKSAVERVMSRRRVAMLDEVPLEEIEFAQPLSRITPLFQAEISAYESWLNKTPLGKRRKKLFGLKTGKEKKKKKKKKKRG